MSPPERKRKKTKKKPSLVLGPTPESTPNPSLPDDLVVSCLARVSRLQYPTLSLVSKSFRSLLASPELYKTRSSLGHTESCLYVCIRFPNETNPRWFTLCQKPDHPFAKKKKKKSSGYALATIPIPHSPPAHWSGLVTVGSNIYNIGGSIYKTPLSTVSVLDCQSHTWREAPSMLIERYYPAANVVDGKIYVTGGCEECDNSSWMEVFDPKTQTWELVPSHGPEICGCKIYKSAVIDGKLHMFGTQNGLAYKPREGRWEREGWEMDLGWPWFSYSVIDNVLFYYSDGFKWYDTEARVWRQMKGLKGLPKFAHYGCVKLADYGGKMAVLWDKYLPSSGYKKKTIWCAVVALERPSSEEIWGKVEWLDAVLTVPEYYEFVCALSFFFPYINLPHIIIGIEGLPDLREKCRKAMVDLGGKMGFLWNEDLDNGEGRIWCAEIALERRDEEDEIWGKYPTLSLVSKSFRSLLASPHLYETRSSLGRTESCLYVCIRFPDETIPRWFTLCQKPDRTLTTVDTMKKKPSGYVLAKLSTPHSRHAHVCSLVTVGSDIYNIGGPVDEANEPSSSVSILDCRSNTWTEGPSMLVKRNYPFASVLDGKIYAAGSSDSSSSEWMEVFDTKTQTWELVSSPPAEMRARRHLHIKRMAGIDGKVHILGSSSRLAYDTREGRWESVGKEMSSGWGWYSYCVVENVIYYYKERGEIKWYDTKGRRWRALKGVKGLHKIPRYTVTLADFGGKMAVLWDRDVASTGDKMIWCTVIALERHNDEEIWGKV
ncbi:unnamed protein product [Brassica oleracea]